MKKKPSTPPRKAQVPPQPTPESEERRARLQRRLDELIRLAVEPQGWVYIGKTKPQVLNHHPRTGKPFARPAQFPSRLKFYRNEKKEMLTLGPLSAVVFVKTNAYWLFIAKEKTRDLGDGNGMHRLMTALCEYERKHPVR